MYTPISFEQMDKFLTSKRFVRVEVKGVKEAVYEFSLPSLPYIALRIYSSIVPNEISRECGKDAIRLVMINKNTNKGISYSKTAYRTENALDNLAKKSNELITEWWKENRNRINIDK